MVMSGRSVHLTTLVRDHNIRTIILAHTPKLDEEYNLKFVLLNLTKLSVEFKSIEIWAFIAIQLNAK